MDGGDKPEELLDSVASVLIRCFFMSIVILCLWGGLILLAGNWIYSVHSWCFPISVEQFYGINYAGIMITKVFVFLFFLLPYIAIKLARRRAI